MRVIRLGSMKGEANVSASMPEFIQTEVDQYIELYQVSKQLEGRMKDLKSKILSFMQENQMDEIWDSKRTGKVQLSASERAPLTTRYTTYDIDVLSTLLTPTILERCVVSVIDKEKLEALRQLGEVDEEVLSHKSTQNAYALKVRMMR